MTLPRCGGAGLALLHKVQLIRLVSTGASLHLLCIQQRSGSDQSCSTVVHLRSSLNSTSSFDDYLGLPDSSACPKAVTLDNINCLCHLDAVIPLSDICSISTWHGPRFCLLVVVIWLQNDDVVLDDGAPCCRNGVKNLRPRFGKHSAYI